MKPTSSFRRILFVFALASAVAMTVSRSTAQDNSKPAATEPVIQLRNLRPSPMAITSAQRFA